MARTLSDTIIIAMIEAATRLSSGRGPIAGSASGSSSGSSVLGTGTQTVTAGQGQAGPAGATAETTSGDGTGVSTSSTPPSGAAPAGGNEAPAGARGEHDTRSAEQIGSDFKTIYGAIEAVVKSSAEQETKSVGFSVR